MVISFLGAGTRKAKMKPEGITLADGRIVEYRFANGRIDLSFVDYCESKYFIKFINVKNIVEKGSIGFDLGTWKYKNKDGNMLVEIPDDQGVIVLSIECEEVEVFPV
jgi:hypothetical protein